MSPPSTKELMKSGLRSFRLESVYLVEHHRGHRRQSAHNAVASSSSLASSSTFPPPPPPPPPLPDPKRVTFTHSYPVVLPLPQRRHSRLRPHDLSRTPTTTFSNKGPAMAGPDRATASDARPRQPPRPLNAWILYRRAKLKELLQEDPELKRLPQSELSKKISRFWKEEPDIIRQQYEFEANVHKSEHQQNFPDYQFKPQKRSDKERDREERRVLKERERAEHRRMRSIAAPATRQPSVTPSADPTPSSPKPPAMTDTRTPAEMQAYQVMRYGNDGPSPPVSEAPSPFGSPVPGSRPLNVVSESERSRSRPPDARSIYAANSTHQLSPLELISALHRASAVQGRSSPSDALSASQAGVASWQPPQVQAQAKSRVESLAVAGPSGFATPDAAVTQTGNMEADPLWPDASAREQTGQHARPDAFGRGIAESSGRNYWNEHTPFSMDGTYSHLYDASNNYLFDMEETPLQGELSSTDMPDIFSLSIPTATLGDDPPGEIEISSENVFATYLNGNNDASSAEVSKQDESGTNKERMNDMATYLQHFGVLNSYKNMSMDMANAARTGPSSATHTEANSRAPSARPQVQSFSSSFDRPLDSTQNTPSSSSQAQSRPQSTVERDPGMEPFVFSQDMYAIPTPNSSMSPTAYTNFPMMSAASSPSYAQSQDFNMNASKQVQSNWSYPIAHPQVLNQPREQALATPLPSPRVSTSQRVQQRQQHQPPRVGSYVAGAAAAVHNVTFNLYPSMSADVLNDRYVAARSPAGDTDKGRTKENVVSARAEGADLKKAEKAVHVRKTGLSWQVASS